MPMANNPASRVVPFAAPPWASSIVAEKPHLAYSVALPALAVPRHGSQSSSYSTFPDPENNLSGCSMLVGRPRKPETVDRSLSVAVVALCSALESQPAWYATTEGFAKD